MKCIKGTIVSIFLVFAAFTTAFSFVSCSSDDDEKAQTDDKTLTSINCISSVCFNKEFLDYVEVKGTYTDFAGQSHEVAVQSSAVSKKITIGNTDTIVSVYPLEAETGAIKDFPASFTLNLSYTLKSTPSDKINVMVLGYNTIIAKNGKTIAEADRIDYTSAQHINTGIRADKFADYVQKLQSTFTLNINKNGAIE